MRVIWLVLVAEIILSLVAGRYTSTFVSSVTLCATILPLFFAERFGFRLPVRFSAAIVTFIFATLFLGEVFDFYERFWWWDVILHGGSAIGFGLIGTLLVLMMFEGDRYAAPPIAIAFFSFTFAMAIGAVWEILEFAMDQIFGLNMQKSGLVDTMYDLIVDMIGATIGATAGLFYLINRRFGGLANLIREFVDDNRAWFRKAFQQDDP